MFGFRSSRAGSSHWSSLAPSLTAILVNCLLVLLFHSAAAQNSGKPSAPPERKGYVGDAVCLPCHQEQGAPYLRTAHHLTSQMPTAESILGSFSTGSNVLMIRDSRYSLFDPGLYFKMEADHDGFHQTAVAEAHGESRTRSGTMDVVIGSGVRGQSYLWWQGEHLYQLPVSYWRDGNQWINSPGTEDYTAVFDRSIVPRCIECHAAYIKTLGSDPAADTYDKPSLVLGIACETCHGPGASHVAMQGQAAHPHPGASQGILSLAKLPRDRQMDICALCHSGALRALKQPAFTYRPGDPLDQYLEPNPSDSDPQPDVHGNQVGMLKRSRCYLSSSTLTCSTCHNVHAVEQPAASYSVKCLGCHQVKSCGEFQKQGQGIAEKCVECHMPMQKSRAIVSETAGREITTSIRTHWIRIYSEVQQP